MSYDISENDEEKSEKNGIFDEIDPERIAEILGKSKKKKCPKDLDETKYKYFQKSPDYGKFDLVGLIRKQKIAKIYDAMPEQTEEAVYEALSLASAELFYKVHQKEELTEQDYNIAMILFEDKDYVQDAEAAIAGKNRRYDGLGFGPEKEGLWSNMSKESILRAIKPKLKKDLEELAKDIYSQKELGD